MLLVIPKQTIPEGYNGAGKKFQLSFITLTLSSKQCHTDNQIKREMLQPFLDMLRKKWKVKYYLWRAESQRNGNIHFHITTEKFIDFRWLRTYWNRQQQKLGYISRYTEQTGKVDPNSTDIHPVYRIKNIGAYLSKYCSKNPDGYSYTMLQNTMGGLRPCFNPSDALEIMESQGMAQRDEKTNSAKYYRTIEGKLWGISERLSKLKNPQVELDIPISNELEFIEKHFPRKVFHSDYCTLYSIDSDFIIKSWLQTIGHILLTRRNEERQRE